MLQIEKHCSGGYQTAKTYTLKVLLQRHGQIINRFLLDIALQSKSLLSFQGTSISASGYMLAPTSIYIT